MYRYRLETREVEPAFQNTEQNADVTRITEFEGTMSFLIELLIR